jgi:hypothetical protein
MLREKSDELTRHHALNPSAQKPFVYGRCDEGDGCDYLYLIITKKSREAATHKKLPDEKIPVTRRTRHAALWRCANWCFAVRVDPTKSLPNPSNPSLFVSRAEISTERGSCSLPLRTRRKGSPNDHRRSRGKVTFPVTFGCVQSLTKSHASTRCGAATVIAHRLASYEGVGVCLGPPPS